MSHVSEVVYRIPVACQDKMLEQQFLHPVSDIVERSGADVERQRVSSHASNDGKLAYVMLKFLYGTLK